MGYLRLMLALYVVFSHAGGIFIPFFNHSVLPVFNFGGRNAVGLFFMISGFYMSLILTDKYKNSLKTFYTNRALRIFPTYWLVLILGVFFIGSDYTNIINILKTTTTGANFYYLFSNIFIFGSDAAYLVSAHGDMGLHWDPFGVSPSHNGFSFLAIPTVFTIAIELMFYAVAPFLVRNIKLTIGVLFGAIIYHMVIISTNNVNIAFQYHLLPASFLYFTLGILAHKMYLNKDFKLTKTFYLLFAIIATSFMLIQPLLPNLFVFLFPFVLPYLFEITKHNKVDRFIGDLSYPLYIVHYSVVKYCWAHQVPLEKLGLIVTGVSLAISILILVAFERPIERFRAKRALRIKPIVP
ncbi:MAG: acyltransferase [Bacteroidota bacterium]|nr:acyltransferase [Bacteroidota bacterium]